MKAWITMLQAKRAYGVWTMPMLVNATTSATWMVPERACHQTYTCMYLKPRRGSETRYWLRNFMDAVDVPRSQMAQVNPKNWVTRPHIPSACAEGRINCGRIKFW